MFCSHCLRIPATTTSCCLSPNKCNSMWQTPLQTRSITKGSNPQQIHLDSQAPVLSAAAHNLPLLNTVSSPYPAVGALREYTSVTPGPHWCPASTGSHAKSYKPAFA